ncbi:restriction endonuclease subunit S [Streptomyces sp. NPDC096323]|uniref:restriction endonuclease subunit S n=1 Tax=Streptomyces sp. NPDC096323 TaxID=3155822 RepID=UPI0033261874
MTDVMASSFPIVPIRRFINDLTDGPFGSSLTSSHYSDNGARVIRLGNIGSATFRDADEAYIPLEYFKKLSRHEVKEGDLIIAGLGDTNHPVGRACLAPHSLGPAIVKADCFRARLDESRLTHRYAAWALSSSAISQQIRTLTRGTTRSRINLDVVREVQVPIPPQEEQRRIADFLDAETARIDRLSTLRSEQLALIRESLAHASAQLSGRITVNGMLGSKQRVVQLRRAISVVQTGSTPADLRPTVDTVAHNDLPWYTPASIDEWMLIDSAEKVTRDSSGLPKFPAGSVIVTGIGESLGKVGYLPHEATGNQQLTALSPSPGVNGRFIAWQLRAAERELREWAQYSRIRIINNDGLKSFPIYLPPRTEQDSAVQMLDSKLAEVQQATQVISRFQRVANERRQALITAAVTGQFDVSTASGRNVTDGVSV